MAKVNALHSFDDELLADLRAFVRRYTVLARKAHVGNPTTQSALVREAVRRELERRKPRAVIQQPVSAEVAADARALRHFREIVQIDLQAVDLDITVEVDAGQMIVECPDFCREAVEAVLSGVCATSVEDALELAAPEWTAPADPKFRKMVEEDRALGEARRAREAAEGGGSGEGAGEGGAEEGGADGA